MATPSLNLIRSIRKSATRLAKSAPYQWGHMGSCNCGHLAQEITKISKADIHRMAMVGEGSWTDQSRSYWPRQQTTCATSGLPIDRLIDAMLAAGLEIQDLENLEYLSDPRVLKALGVSNLAYNKRKDVIMYLKAWADLLEEQLMRDIPENDLEQQLLKSRAAT